MDAVEKLIATGVDVNIQSNYGWTALKLAAEKGVSKFMRMMQRHMNNVGGEFTYEETDDEIVVSGTCGTGGRYIRKEDAQLSFETSRSLSIFGRSMNTPQPSVLSPPTSGL